MGYREDYVSEEREPAALKPANSPPLISGTSLQLAKQ